MANFCSKCFSFKCDHRNNQQPEAADQEMQIVVEQPQTTDLLATSRSLTLLRAAVSEVVLEVATPLPVVLQGRQPTATHLKLHLGCKITNESDIKRGCFGAVYFIHPGSSYHPSGAPSDQDLALKVIELQDAKEDNLTLFQKEVSVNQRIKDDGRQEHIVPFYGAFVFGFNLATQRYEPRTYDSSLPGGLIPTPDFVPYFGALWLQKCTADLYTWMLERKFEHLPEEISEQLFKQVGQALLFLHAQQPAIVHCDLKEANIGVLVNGANVTFKLLDFGICQDEAPYNGATFCQMEEGLFAKLLLELTWDKEERNAYNPSTLKDVLRAMKYGSMGLSDALAELPA